MAGIRNHLPVKPPQMYLSASGLISRTTPRYFIQCVGRSTLWLKQIAELHQLRAISAGQGVQQALLYRMKYFSLRVGLCSQTLKNISTYAGIVKQRNNEKRITLWLQISGVFSIAPNVDNMKGLGFGATNLSHATKVTT